MKRIGSLPQAISKAAAVALPGGRLMILGGYTGNGLGRHDPRRPAEQAPRSSGISRNRRTTRQRPLVGGSVYLFGGGSSVSMPTSSASTRAPERRPSAGPIGEPLSDLGAVTIGGNAYLVGGYTGSRVRDRDPPLRPRGTTTVVARLPQGTRYAGVTAIGRTIYVAGGLTTAGATRAIYALAARREAATDRRRSRSPEDHAALAALDGTALLRRRPHDPRDRSAHSGKVTVAATAAGLALRPDRDDASEPRSSIAGGGTSGIWT